MNPYLLQLLRVVHIVSAAFWLGAASTLAFFVFPTLLASELTGVRLMRQIMVERKLRVYTILAMLLTIGSGIYLYWYRFAPMSGPPRTSHELDYALGGLLGLLAGLVMLIVNMPTARKLSGIVGKLGTTAPSSDQGAEIVRLARKLLIATRSIAILTLGAAALMALARYAG